MHFVFLTKKLVWPFRLVWRVKIYCAIYTVWLFLIVVLSGKIVKLEEIAKYRHLKILSPLAATGQIIKLA